MQPGDKVVFTNPEAIARYGKDELTVASVNTLTNSVELEELGSVDRKDLRLASDPSPEVVRQAEAVKEHVLSELLLQDGSLIDMTALDRIEAIAGQLLSHTDSNVRFSMREVLNLVWDLSGKEPK